MRTKMAGCLRSAGSVQMRFALVNRLRLHPLIGFLLRFVLADSVALLNAPDQLIFLAGNLFRSRYR